MRSNKLALIICMSAILLCSSCNDVVNKPITVVLGTFDKEVIMLEEILTNKREHEIEGIRLLEGRLNGRIIVVAHTGMGKVNAAMTTMLVIEHAKPSEVIFTGIAGGINPELFPGDIVVAEKTAQHDLGILTPAGISNEGTLNPVNGEQNPVFFPADERLLKLAQRAAKQVELEKAKTDTGEIPAQILQGIIVTGDIFAASTAKRIELRQRLGADAVETEGAAVAQVCFQHGIPCLIIRGISDRANEPSLEDVNKFSELAANNSAKLTIKLVTLLSSRLSLEESGKIE